VNEYLFLVPFIEGVTEGVISKMIGSSIWEIGEVAIVDCRLNRTNFIPFGWSMGRFERDFLEWVLLHYGNESMPNKGKLNAIERLCKTASSFCISAIESQRSTGEDYGRVSGSDCVL
jgi:hypothetical protein